MDAKTYVKNVLVTEARDFAPVQQRMSEIKNIRMIHALAGIDSELSEVIAVISKFNNNYHSWQDYTPIDRVNLMEEISDIFWYLGIAADALDSVDEILSPPGFHGDKIKEDEDLCEAIMEFVVKSSDLTGILFDVAVKKSIFYGKTIDLDPVKLNLRYIFIGASFLLEFAGYTVEQARERNIEKLKARYGDKFTEAAALDRNLELERTILEKK